MFSRTTMELSTTIPTANAKPASEITFKVRPSSFRTRKVPTTLMGIAAATMNVLVRLRRNSKRAMTAKMLPMTKLCCTSPIALWT